MTSKDLAEFITKKIPTFKNVELIGSGIAYHYTSHAEAILKSGQFLGAPINNQLDKTQIQLNSPPATSDPGVVFAYLDIKNAIEEGFNCDIFEINFQSAVKATHQQEAFLEAPPTILILTSEIKSFRLIDNQ